MNFVIDQRSTGHTQVDIGGAMIDLGMADDIKRLWAEGVTTYYSCQGSRGCELYAPSTRYVVVAAADLATALRLLPWAENGSLTLGGHIAVYGRHPHGWTSASRMLTLRPWASRP